MTVNIKSGSIAGPQVSEGARLQSFAGDFEKKFSRDKLSISTLVVSLLSLAAQVALLLSSWDKLPPEVPIFYSRVWGAAILTSPFALWILPLILVSFSMANFLIATFLVKENIFLVRVLLVTSCLIAITTLWGSVKIISLIV